MGQDKALIELGGQTLLERAVIFCRSFASEVLISSDSEDHQIEGIKRIPDMFKDCGPISGIYSCLKVSSHDWNFVLSVDAPFVKKEFVDLLVKSATDFEAIVPVHHGKKEPLIALYSKKTIPQFEQKIKAGNFKLHFLLQDLNTRFVESEAWLEKFPGMFDNLNFPGDLNKA